MEIFVENVFYVNLPCKLLYLSVWTCMLCENLNFFENI